MPNFIVDPKYDVEMQKLEITTPAHADVLNEKYQQLLNTDAALQDAQSAHANDTTKHITTAERTTWNNHSTDNVRHISATERTTWNSKANATVATASTPGLLSAADKSKLDGIASQANKTVISNNLTTTAAGSALDAAQGKALNDRITKQERVLSATLTTAGWSAAAPHTQMVNVSGITANDVPMIGVVLSGTVEQKKAQQAAWNMVSEIDTGAGKITATCLSSKPAVNIVLQIKGA